MNETEETTLITSIDDDDRNDNSKSNRYKYVTIAAAVSVVGLVTGTSSFSIGTSLLRQDNTDADADAAKAMAAVGFNNLDVGCKDKYSVCRGFGQGNCCGGLECDGPYVGTCQYSGCSAIGDGCAGFGQGNCCNGGVCCYRFIPGAGGTCYKNYDAIDNVCRE